MSQKVEGWLPHHSLVSKEDSKIDKWARTLECLITVHRFLNKFPSLAKSKKSPSIHMPSIQINITESLKNNIKLSFFACSLKESFPLCLIDAVRLLDTLEYNQKFPALIASFYPSLLVLENIIFSLEVDLFVRIVHGCHSL